MRIQLYLTSLALLLAGGAVELRAELTSVEREFFEAKIRPVLAENCYKCHSVEHGKSKGGLVLDSREALRKGGESGPAIERGAPEKSLLIRAIGYHDPDLQMPPKGEKLTSAQVADLTDWVTMGAPDPRDAAREPKLTGLSEKARAHWAYQPVVKPAMPQVQNANWGRTPVDAFILEKLQEKQMIPAPDASKETLLRRASYDLTGLPPTPQEVANFLADESPGAFEKVIDRLLASSHYGERWGRHWLDTARYSDTVGGDRQLVRRGLDYRYPYAWTYRDYVIGAFNSDKPYDHFIREQLAADLLPAKDPNALAALGFLTVGERFRNPNDIINDRIDVVSKGFLGMTVTCARCHDHMFDPIPTEDYYALHGVFASTVEPAEKPVIAAGGEATRAEFERRLSQLEERNRTAYYRLAGKVARDFQEKVRGYLLTTTLAGGRKNAEAASQRRELIRKHKLDPQIVQVMARKLRGEGSIAILAPLRRFAELKPEEWATRAPELTERVREDDLRRPLNRLVRDAFSDTPPTSMEDVLDRYERLFAEAAEQRAAFLEASAKTTSGKLTDFDLAIVELLQMPMRVLPASELNTASIRETVAQLPPQLTGRAGFTFGEINELELTHPGAPARPMLVADAARPRNSSVFIRGQAETRGAIVPRRFLQVLSTEKPAPFTRGSGRLELAEAIASETNPLTARVLVNRIWMHHFGQGFVPTPDDLGTQAELPSHPKLLDYLAATFMEQGWSLKKLHKLIMQSRVYQQSSRTLPQFEEADPENRLLWRANIRRLDFEAMRDSLLVFSGNLDRTTGGQPVNLTQEPYSFRRSVYGYIDRGNLPELMQQFDFSDPDMPNSKRSTTVVPQQALFLMNSPMAVDVARRIVARPEVTSARDDLARTFALYRVIFQRSPDASEIHLAQQFVAQEAAKQPSASDAPEVDAGPRRPNRQQRKAMGGMRLYESMRPIQNLGDKVERRPLTPWETYAQALLFTNEAAYVN
ncbi:MAG TPA: PSD1 and planctomycete cytochrome C domain-containing protein [Chthoniobacteraceae bacterium]|jgi:hypothetical protein